VLLCDVATSAACFDADVLLLIDLQSTMECCAQCLCYCCCLLVGLCCVCQQQLLAATAVAMASAACLFLVLSYVLPPLCAWSHTIALYALFEPHRPASTRVLGGLRLLESGQTAICDVVKRSKC
jgi:hypothetical protein